MTIRRRRALTDLTKPELIDRLDTLLDEIEDRAAEWSANDTTLDIVVDDVIDAIRRAEGHPVL